MAKNIIGNGFDQYVIDQINLRQSLLKNSTVRDNNVLQYITNRSPWIRLTSGVNLDKSRATTLGSAEGNILATNNVLFSTNVPGGVGFGTKAYGFQSTSDYGYVPMPGITSADIKSLNRGSLREATVNITCHNLTQFKVIDALYMRLKYSVLLEWGHSVWIDNSGTLRKDIPSIQSKFLENGHGSQEALLQKIRESRQNAAGNYDALYGLVKNFTWSIRPDGGYDISINLISAGDVIESLKVNVNNSTPNTTIAPAVAVVNSNELSPEEREKKENLPSIIANKDKSTLHQIMFGIKGDLDVNFWRHGPSLPDRTGLTCNDVISYTKQYSQYDLVSANYITSGEKANTWNSSLVSSEAQAHEFFNIATADDGTLGKGKMYYIKLGSLLRLVQAFLLKYDTSNGNPGDHKPLFYIDYDYENNICLTLDRQISADPRICLLAPNISSATAGANEYEITQTVKRFLRSTTTIISSGTAGTGGGGTVPTAPVDTFLRVVSGPTVIGTSTTIPSGRTPGVETAIKEDKDLSTVATSATIGSRTETVEVEITYETYVIKGLIGGFTITGAGGTTYTAGNILGTLDNSFRVPGDENKYIGRFMHIYVNLNYISDTLSGNIDKDGKTSVYDFLTELMRGIQGAIGNINKFEVVCDETTNTFRIIDNTVIPNSGKFLGASFTVARFNPYLLTSTEGSFVKDISLKSELNNSFASQISIGAQVNGNKVGENATALSRLNEGFIDRVIPKKSSIIDDKNNDQNVEIVYAQNVQRYENLKNVINWGTVTEDDINNNKEALVDMYKYELGKATNDGEIEGVGFIPLNLQLTMDGLSGPKIYEVYTIDETLLPLNYRDKIQFIIKGISHKIDDNGWVTTLESLGGPRNAALKVSGRKSFTVTQRAPVAGNSGGGGANSGGTIGGSGACATKGGKSITGQNNVTAKYGKPGDDDNLTRITPPYPLYYQAFRKSKNNNTYAQQITSLCVHKDVAPSLLKAFNEIKAAYTPKEIEDLGLNCCSGTLVVRKKRGGNTWSMHSWGIAIDLLAGENVLKANNAYGSTHSNPPAQFTLPDYAKFVNIMESNGWYSLGKWGDYDWMHFQAWNPRDKE